MVGPFGKPPEARCCCGQFGCVGCCVPVAEGTNAPLNIPFEISAPGCPELDGWASQFIPSAPPPSQELSACGVCGVYAAEDLTPTVQGAAYNPPAPCVLLSPPGYVGVFGPWRFTLHCDEGPAPSGTDHLDSCCSRLRLGISLHGGTTERLVTASSCSCVGGLSVIFPLDDLIDVSWLDPGIFCPIDGQFPWACSMAGATLVI